MRTQWQTRRFYKHLILYNTKSLCQLSLGSKTANMLGPISPTAQSFDRKIFDVSVQVTAGAPDLGSWKEHAKTEPGGRGHRRSSTAVSIDNT